LSFTVFTNKNREGILHKFVCAVSLHVAEIPKASIKAREPSLPIVPSGIVAYGFVGQPFLKQLYVIGRIGSGLSSGQTFSQEANSENVLRFYFLKKL